MGSDRVSLEGCMGLAAGLTEAGLRRYDGPVRFFPHGETGICNGTE